VIVFRQMGTVKRLLPQRNGEVFVDDICQRVGCDCICLGQLVFRLDGIDQLKVDLYDHAWSFIRGG